MVNLLSINTRNVFRYYVEIRADKAETENLYNC